MGSVGKMIDFSSIVFMINFSVILN